MIADRRLIIVRRKRCAEQTVHSLRKLGLGLFLVVVCLGLFSYTRAGVYTRTHTREAIAATSSTLNFQARLMNASGSIVADGSYSIEFNLYNVSSGGSTQWTETQSITTKNGYLSANLGSVTPFPGTIDWTQEQWLTMNVDSDGEMNPRLKLTAVPYALTAGQLARTNGANKATLNWANPTGNRTITLPDASGTVAVSASGNISLDSAGNVTLTGQVGIGNGGTGANTQQSAINALSGLTTTGDLLYYNGSNSVRLGRGANGECLISNTTTIVWGSCSGVVTTLQSAYGAGSNPHITLNSTQGALAVQDNATPLGGDLFVVSSNGGGTKYLAVTSSGISTSGSVTASNGLTVSAGGASITGGLNNNNGGISNAGAVAGATTYSGSGNINTTGGAIQTNSTTRIDNSGNLTNIGDITGTGAVTLMSGGTSGLTLKTLNQSTASTHSAVVAITSGDASGSTSNSGNVTIDAGTATGTAGIIQIGTTNASGVTIGRSAITTTINGLTTIGGNAVANGIATGTTATATASPGTNTTTINLTAAAFADNDVVFINNVGQDYYTRIISGGGTSTLTVSPAVSYDASVTIEKYTVQNIGATSTDYSTQANRFFQGYFLGGVVVGASSTTLSDGNLLSTGTLTLQRTGGTTALGGNLTVNGTVSGLTNLSLSGTISGGTTYSGSGNINTTGGAIQTNSTTRIDNSGNLTNIGDITGTGAVTLMSGGTGALTLKTNNQSVASTNSAELTLTSGNASGSTSNSGNVTIDSGTATGTAGLVTIGTSNATGLTLSRSGIATTIGGTLVVNGSSASVGTNSLAGTLTLYDGSSNTGLFQTTALGSNRTYTLPDSSGTVCLDGNNCSFVQLGASSIQTDSSTNPSIGINKTGASGNILTLQKNGADVFTIANGGAVQISTTSTTAFQVRNAGGTNFFTVDTSGSLITVGNSDTTGVLFVLDTKTNAGDPTGVNGGSYYNSNNNKNRCYENSIWTDCITSPILGETTLGVAGATVTVTLARSPEHMKCYIESPGRSLAGTPYLRFNSDAGAAKYGWNAYGILTTAVTDWQDSSDSEIQLSGTNTSATPFSAIIEITDFTATRKNVTWSATSAEAIGTDMDRYSGGGTWGDTTTQITSVNFTGSAGNYNAGTHAWCEGRDIR